MAFVRWLFKWLVVPAAVAVIGYLVLAPKIGGEMVQKLNEHLPESVGKVPVVEKGSEPEISVSPRNR